MLISRFILVIITIVVTVAGVTIGFKLVERIDRNVIQEEVTNALVANCEEDKRFRKEYRKRARSERKNIQSDINANEALIEVVNAFPKSKPLITLGRALDVENERLIRQLSLINILPLPDCLQLKQRIEEQ